MNSGCNRRQGSGGCSHNPVVDHPINRVVATRSRRESSAVIGSTQDLLRLQTDVCPAGHSGTMYSPDVSTTTKLTKPQARTGLPRAETPHAPAAAVVMSGSREQPPPGEGLACGSRLLLATMPSAVGTLEWFGREALMGWGRDRSRLDDGAGVRPEGCRKRQRAHPTVAHLGDASHWLFPLVRLDMHASAAWFIWRRRTAIGFEDLVAVLGSRQRESGHRPTTWWHAHNVRPLGVACSGLSAGHRCVCM
jgi:hypothetical protein